MKTAEILPTAQGTNQRRRILIVDDEDIVPTTLYQAISKDHEVIVCDNGASAMAHMRSGIFDAGLIDFGLPGQRGDAVAQALKTQDPHFVAISITGWHFESDDPRLDLFDFYVRKPFTKPQEIHSVLTKALSLLDQRMANKI